MYCGIGGRRSLSEENLHASARPQRKNVTLDEHSVKFERIADLKKTWRLRITSDMKEKDSERDCSGESGS